MTSVTSASPKAACLKRVRPGSRVAALLAAACFWAVAFGHAQLLTSEPAADTVLDVAPAQVTLHFSEAVQTRFSVFKVYRLDTPDSEDAQSPAPVVGEPMGGTERLRINALAGVLTEGALKARGDDDERADTGLLDPADLTTDVTLGLRPDLAAGYYVVMWRALAADTHSTPGFFVFRLVAPTP